MRKYTNAPVAAKTAARGITGNCSVCSSRTQMSKTRTRARAAARSTNEVLGAEALACCWMDSCSSYPANKSLSTGAVCTLHCSTGTNVVLSAASANILTYWVIKPFARLARLKPLCSALDTKIH